MSTHLSKVPPTRPVLFSYPHPAYQVLIAGSFSNWCTVPLEQKEDLTWEVILFVTPGNHMYKFVVDGSWVWDFEQPYVSTEEGLVNNIINVPPPVPGKKLIIVRGISGSGKSTLARKLLLEYGGRIHAEADLFMVDENGNYAFNPKRLSIVHASCSSMVEQAMSDSENLIVVSNTSIQYWEMFTYVNLAKKYGYQIEFTEPTTEWRYNAQILFEKCQHSVPLATIKLQVENFLKYPTLPVDQLLPKILATYGIRPTIYRTGVNFHPYSRVYYYGISNTDPRLSPWIEKLKSHLSPEDFKTCHLQRLNRDGGPIEDGSIIYHITLTGFNPGDDLTPELGNSYMQTITKLLETGETPKLLGIGKAHESYYVVVEWNAVNKIREELGLKPLDLHITLGFMENDVHTLPKTPDTIILSQ